MPLTKLFTIERKFQYVFPYFFILLLCRYVPSLEICHIDHDLQNSSRELFQWRPYTLVVEGWLIPKFYKEKEEWIIVEGKISDLEIESFI